MKQTVSGEDLIMEFLLLVFCTVFWSFIMAQSENGNSQTTENPKTLLKIVADSIDYGKFLLIFTK